MSLLGLSGCTAIMGNQVTARDRETRTFNVPARPTVIVETFNGELRVLAGADGKVEADIERTGSGSSPEAAEADLKNVVVDVTQEDGTLRIVARRTGPKTSGNSGASIALEVPKRSILSLTSRNGEIRSEDIEGAITARTSNGGIAALGARGQVDLETSNGAVEVAAEDALVTARTSNGRVSFAGTLAPGEHALTTSNGDVALRLPTDARLRFDARTSNGWIVNRFPDFQREQPPKPIQRLSGQIGDGPPPDVAVHLETSNGGITLEPLAQHPESPRP